MQAVPHYGPFLGMFLGRDTRYRFVRTTGETVWLHAGEGAEQGDVWGPVIYSLALAPRIAELERELRERAGGGEDDVAVPAYLDELVIRVPPWLVGEVVPRSARTLAPMGGRLNERKCQAWSPRGGPPPLPNDT